MDNNRCKVRSAVKGQRAWVRDWGLRGAPEVVVPCGGPRWGTRCHLAVSSIYVSSSSSLLFLSFKSLSLYLFSFVWSFHFFSFFPSMAPKPFPFPPSSSPTFFLILSIHFRPPFPLLFFFPSPSFSVSFYLPLSLSTHFFHRHIRVYDCILFSFFLYYPPLPPSFLL